MTKIETKFLREVQARGWQIEQVGQGECIGQCPVPGCGVRAKLKPGSTIPPRLETSPATYTILESADQALGLLRGRRKSLGLTISEVEECAGLTVDVVAKYEAAAIPKVPNVESFLLWASALGLEVVVRPAKLPPITLSTIETTRHLQGRRQKS